MTLDAASVAAANKAFYAAHPEQGGKPLVPGQPGYATLAAEWKKHYADAAALSPTGPAPTASGGSPSLPAPTAPCGEHAGGASELAGPSLSEIKGGAAGDAGTLAPPQTETPCDFDRVVVRCKHCPDPSKKREIADLRFWRQNGERKDNLKMPPPNSLRTPTGVFEVVSSHHPGFGENDKITFSLEGGPGYCSEYKHAQLAIYDQLEDRWIENTPKKCDSIEFEPLSMVLPEPAVSPIGLDLAIYHFLPNLGSRTYHLWANSCHYQPGGGPHSLGSFGLMVRAYPRETYKLEIKLKPVFKRQVDSSETTTGNTTEIAKSSTTTKLQTESSTSTSLKYGDGGAQLKGSQSFSDTTGKVVQDDEDNFDGPPTSQLSYEAKPAEGRLEYAEKNIRFTRDGSEISGILDFQKVLNFVENFANAVQALSSLFKKWQPKYGWFLSWNFEFLYGSLSFEWGKREWKDHTAYSFWDARAKMTLIDGKIEVKYGFEFGNESKKVAAYFFIELSGKIAISVGMQSDPDKPSGLEGEGAVEGSIGGTGGLKAQVGEAAEFEGSATTSLDGSGNATAGETTFLKIEYQVLFAGIVGKVKVSVAWSLWSWQDTHEFIPASQEPVLKGVFPDTADEKTGLPDLGL